MTNLMQKNARARTLTAAALLILFAFTGVFAIHHNGNRVSEAYAATSSSSNNNNPDELIWGCGAAILLCLGQIAMAVNDCLEHGWLSVKCAKAAAKAILVCLDVAEKCNFQPPWPQPWIDAGWV